jgi:retinitis pigmentosa 1
MSSVADSPRAAHAFPDDSEDSGATDYKPHSFMGTLEDPVARQNLYGNSRTKMCYFYKDGDIHQKAFKMVINPRRYHDLDILKNELTEKVPDLPFGVRSIYTPHGRTVINSLDDLQDSGNYVCSTHRNKARGVDIARVSKRPTWHRGRPGSKHMLNRYFRHQEEQAKSPPRKKAWSQINKDNEHLYATRAPKKITVLKNGEPHIRHTILLNRKTSQSFEQVIEDMCQIFQMPIRKVYTVEGRPVSIAKHYLKTV